MKHVKRAITLLVCPSLIVAGEGELEAQQQGPSAKISHGVVVGAEKVKLKGNDALRGAPIGRTIAYASSSGGSSSKKRRNKALGAAAGGLLGASPAEERMLFTVKIGSSTILLFTDQTEIHLDNCVVVKTTSRGAKIRRVTTDVCSPQTQDVVGALEPGFEEEAAARATSKPELAAAKTDTEFDRAMTGVSNPCND